MEVVKKDIDVVGDLAKCEVGLLLLKLARTLVDGDKPVLPTEELWAFACVEAKEVVLAFRNPRGLDDSSYLETSSKDRIDGTVVAIDHILGTNSVSAEGEVDGRLVRVVVERAAKLARQRALWIRTFLAPEKLKRLWGLGTPQA